MTCVPRGSPPPRVTWYHGDMLLSNSSGMYLGLDGSLSVAAVQPSDAGVYKCTAENVAGSMTAVAKVVVHGKFFLLI